MPRSCRLQFAAQFQTRDGVWHEFRNARYPTIEQAQTRCVLDAIERHTTQSSWSVWRGLPLRVVPIGLRQ